MSLIRLLRTEKNILCPSLAVRSVTVHRRELSSDNDVIMTQSDESLPFFVKRTKSNNLPVYLDYKSGRSRTITIVRKIEGDVHALEKRIREMIGVPDLLTRVDELLGHIVLHGDYKNKVMQYLKSLGY